MIFKLPVDQANLTPEFTKKIDGSPKKSLWYVKFNTDYVRARKLYEKTIADIDAVTPDKAPETYHAMRKMEADLLSIEKQLYGMIGEPYIQEDVDDPSALKKAIAKASFITKQGSVIFRGTKTGIQEYSNQKRK